MNINDNPIIKWLFDLPPQYTPLEVILLGLGFVFWILAYIIVIKNSRKFKLVEIPMLIVALDIAWEFTWGFVLDNNLGRIFNIGCILWFSFDTIINYRTLKYGKKLVTNPWIKKNFVPLYIFFVISGIVFFYFMKEVHEDNGLGVMSAYLLNIAISSMYIYQVLNFPQYRGQGFSYKVAWFKFIGSGVITIACFLKWGDNGFLLTMCVITALLDILYIYLFKNYKPSLEASA